MAASWARTDSWTTRQWFCPKAPAPMTATRGCDIGLRIGRNAFQRRDAESAESSAENTLEGFLLLVGQASACQSERSSDISCLFFSPGSFFAGFPAQSTTNVGRGKRSALPLRSQRLCAEEPF